MARSDWREPYVGEGADGARRSAEIDRSEADTLDRSDLRWAVLLESAGRWERQAEEIELEETRAAMQRLSVLDQWDVLQTALLANSAAQAALVEAKRAEARTSTLVMEARYQLSLTVACTYCGAEAGVRCKGEEGVNLHRYPQQYGVRESDSRDAARTYLAEQN